MIRVILLFMLVWFFLFFGIGSIKYVTAKAALKFGVIIVQSLIAAALTMGLLYVMTITF